MKWEDRLEIRELLKKVDLPSDITKITEDELRRFQEEYACGVRKEIPCKGVLPSPIPDTKGAVATAPLLVKLVH